MASVVGGVLAGEDRDVTGVSLSLTAGAAQHAGPFELTKDDWDRGMVVRVDDGRVVEECNERDNSVELGTWPCGAP